MARISNLAATLPAADMTAKRKTDLARLQGPGGYAFGQAYTQETVRINVQDTMCINVQDTMRINAQDTNEDAKQFAETQDETIRQFVQQLQVSEQAS